MVINLQYEGAREIFYIPEVRILDSIEIKSGEFSEYKIFDYKNYKYRTELSLSWLSGVALGSSFGIGGYITFGFSDWTGDNWIILQTQSYIQDITNAIFFLDYLYLKKRWDLDLSSYQYWSISYLKNFNKYSYDKILGSSFLIYYPFNRFDRIELGLTYNYYTRYLGILQFLDLFMIQFYIKMDLMAIWLFQEIKFYIILGVQLMVMDFSLPFNQHLYFHKLKIMSFMEI